MRKPDFSSSEMLIFTMRPKAKYASTHRPEKYFLTWAQVVTTWQVAGEEPIPEDLIGAGFVHFTAFHDVKVEWMQTEEDISQEKSAKTPEEDPEERYYRGLQAWNERHSYD